MPCVVVNEGLSPPSGNDRARFAGRTKSHCRNGSARASTLYQNLFTAFAVSALQEPVTSLLAWAIRPASQRMMDRRHLTQVVAAGFLVCSLAALAATTWAKMITNLTGWMVPSWDARQTWLLPWFYYMIVFAAWFLVRQWSAAQSSAAQAAARAVDARAEADRMELQHLRHQLDPHFLFNALGGIASDITLRPETAVEMVRDLADYLRFLLDHRDASTATLATEIEAVTAYLALHKARFGPDISFSLAADEKARMHHAPAFLLQTLVENAVKHGLRSAAKPLIVDIKASSDGERLVIVVENTGILTSNWAAGGQPGVGHSVLRRRLALHYPDRHRFDLRQVGDKVTAIVELQGRPC